MSSLEVEEHVLAHVEWPMETRRMADGDEVCWVGVKVTSSHHRPLPPDFQGKLLEAIRPLLCGDWPEPADGWEVRVCAKTGASPWIPADPDGLPPKSYPQWRAQEIARRGDVLP